MNKLVYVGVLTALLGSAQVYASDASILADFAEERNASASTTHPPITPIIPSDPQTTEGATPFLQIKSNTLSNEGALAICRSEHFSIRSLREVQTPSIDSSLLQDVINFTPRVDLSSFKDIRNSDQSQFLVGCDDLKYYNSLDESLFTRSFKMALRTGVAFGVFSILGQLKG